MASLVVVRRRRSSPLITQAAGAERVVVAVLDAATSLLASWTAVERQLALYSLCELTGHVHAACAHAP